MKMVRVPWCSSDGAGCEGCPDRETKGAFVARGRLLSSKKVVECCAQAKPAIVTVASVYGGIPGVVELKADVSYRCSTLLEEGGKNRDGNKYCILYPAEIFLSFWPRLREKKKGPT